MLLDTASLYFRAYFGVPDSVRAPDGTPVNAVRGLLDFIARLVQDHRPDDLVACMDSDWRPQWRVDLIPSYKAHRVAEEIAEAARTRRRSPTPSRPQVPVIEEVLDALGIARVGRRRGTRPTTSSAPSPARATGPVDIVTGDRDLFQLVDDARGVRVLYPLKGVGTLQTHRRGAGCARSTAWTARATSIWRCCAATPATACPGVPGHRREDGGQAAGRVRRPGRDHGRRRRPDVEADPRRSASGCDEAADVPGGRARRSCGSPRDVPLPDVDPALPRATARPGARWKRSRRAGGSAARCSGCSSTLRTS